MTMMYPSYLPHPQFPDKIEQMSNRISTEMSTGRTRDRRRHIIVPTFQTLVFRMPKDKAAAFLGWVDHALSGGIRWFTLNQRTELGVVPLQIKMKDHPLKDAKPKGGKFYYTVKCEIRQYPIQSEELTVSQILFPHTLNELMTEIDMSRYYTESWKNDK
ncbi:hypothetical protein WKI32_11455 [Vibrio alginolyticus]|uniref:hypothetical protein n=1 Tax=Vibrio TaxID=662 RepID=UPI001BD39593|nr:MULTISPECIES: hypothetical protein [Vibrio]MBT0024063.1 hypothetical protein [Vibrio alginolyticus]MCA2441706.1 hypothetical protein [Vibrio alginolyticus]MDW1732067.1 hypothetical protein [Vibrio sp. Vb2356]MDW1934249.1 hypothetical protein [Vibrio sp. 970]